MSLSYLEIAPGPFGTFQLVVKRDEPCHFTGRQRKETL